MNLLEKYFSDLQYKEGIYYKKSDLKLSYPDDGNQICFNVEDNSFWFKHRNQIISLLFKKKSPKKILFDVGGGNGFVSFGLMKEGINSILIEPGIQGCLNAKQRGLKNIVCSTLEESGCLENSIPAIGLFDVVEHIENDKLFIKKIHVYLENEGFLYLTVPSFSFLWSSEDELAGHYRRYTLKEIEHLLESNGFKINFSSYMFSFLPIPILIIRTLIGKFKPRKSSVLKTVKKEHNSSNYFIKIILNFFLKRETRKMSKGKKIKFGSSCIVVAQKIKNK